MEIPFLWDKQQIWWTFLTYRPTRGEPASFRIHIALNLGNCITAKLYSQEHLCLPSWNSQAACRIQQITSYWLVVPMGISATIPSCSTKQVELTTLFIRNYKLIIFRYNGTFLTAFSAALPSGISELAPVVLQKFQVHLVLSVDCTYQSI